MSKASEEKIKNLIYTAPEHIDEEQSDEAPEEIFNSQSDSEEEGEQAVGASTDGYSGEKYSEEQYKSVTGTVIGAAI